MLDKQLTLRIYETTRRNIYSEQKPDIERCKQAAIDYIVTRWLKMKLIFIENLIDV